MKAKTKAKVKVTEDNNNVDNDDNADDNDNESTGTNDTTDSRVKKMLAKAGINAEVNPPKSLVIIWLLMAAELGFDLITTGIVFFSSIGKTECCGFVVSMGPLPMTTTVPFFLLIVAEIIFLGRAILLTLWPSIFETSRIATHGYDDDNNEDYNHDQVGFEVAVATDKKLTATGVDDDANNNDDKNNDEARNKAISTSKEAVKEKTSSQSDSGSKDNDDDNDDDNNNDVKELYMDEIPEFIDNNNNQKRGRSYLKRVCCCFLRWNARMVLAVLNLLTLLNPFFGCVIAWILLYQSDKNESFVVLGIECLSIILHFVSVRMEGGLRTWCSKLLHSVALLPFFVTVILVLVYIREGGVCYSVEKEMFLFSGCELCPVELVPPDSNGMCTATVSNGTSIDDDGNYTAFSYSLEGVSGGFLQEFQSLGSSINGLKDMQNLASLIDRGAEQDSYCSPDINFCFYTF